MHFSTSGLLSPPRGIAGDPAISTGSAKIRGIKKNSDWASVEKAGILERFDPLCRSVRG